MRDGLDESSFSPLSHAISQTHLTHHVEVLTAPAGSQDGEGDGAGHTDEQEEEEVEAGLVVAP